MRQQFKVGDICEVVNPEECYLFIDAGKYVRITEVTPLNYAYDILNENMENIDYCFGCLDDDDLRLYRPATKEQSAMFKVGDKVRCIREHSSVKVGDTATVVSIPGILVYDERGFMDADKGMQINNGRWTYQEWWELVTDAVAEKPEKKPEWVRPRMMHPSCRPFIGLDFWSSPRKTMQKLSILAKKFLSANTRTLIKAGFLDSELEITDRGREALEQILFMDNEEALLKAARAQIREDKKEEAEEE